MHQLRSLALALAIALTVPIPVGAGEPVDLGMVGQIRTEGFQNSKVMETLAELTDVIGPRLTGSPQMKRANEWTRDRLAAWGLLNARLESWGPFGRGWTFERSALHILTPHQTPLMALPEAWTPGTTGPVRGKLKRVTLGSEADFETHRGTLAGAILLLEAPRELVPRDQPLLRRYSEQELEALAQFELPSDRRGAWRRQLGERMAFRKSLRRFLAEEGVVALLSPSSRDGGALRPTAGGAWEMDAPRGVPSLVLAAEHYNWLVRLLERKLDVELEVDVSTTFHEDDAMAYNTVAEIPGSGQAPEIVMLGGHLDSWHAGTGATDNAAGCAVAMEAMRILQALGVKPRRTIRVALWSGEEQGLLGSRAYVASTSGHVRIPWIPPSGPSRVSVEQRRTSADSEAGSRAAVGLLQPRQRHRQDPRHLPPGERGRSADLRGLAEAPSRTSEPSTLTMRNTRGTDHVAFDAVGLPGFQFIQDELDYETQHPPHQLGRLRSSAARGPDAGVSRHGQLRLPRRDPGRAPAAQAAAQGPAGAAGSGAGGRGTRRDAATVKRAVPWSVGSGRDQPRTR